MQQDVGRILKEGRMALGLELGEVARQTCINPRYLRALEEGRFKVVPSVYDKAYLKIYAKLLKIDAPALLALYDLQKNGPPVVAAAPSQA